MKINTRFNIFGLATIWLLFRLQPTTAQTIPNNAKGWFPDGQVNTIVSDANHIYMGGAFSNFGKEKNFTYGTGVITTGIGDIIDGFLKLNGNLIAVLSDGARG